MTPEEFQARFMPYAQGVAQRTGLDPRLVLSQAALETGWGRSAPNNNFFGIKSHGQAGGNTLMTQEVVDGQTITIPQSFRGYETPEQSFQGYADFILNNPRYRDVMAQGDLTGQVEAMGRSGYATDPEYANKLASIARRFGGDVQFSTRGGDTPTAVAADTRSALGFPQRNEGNAMMPPREKSQGLLQTLGLQKRGTGGPEGDKPFYQRDRFADLLGGIAVGANTLRANPDQNIPAMVSQQRQQRAGNRTAEWLGQQEGGAEFAQMIASGADPAAVLMEYRNSRMPVAPEQTSGMQNYQFLLSQGVDPQTAMERAFGGGGVSVDVNTGSEFGTIPPGYELFTDPATGARSMRPIAGGPVEKELQAEADQDALAAEVTGVAAQTVFEDTTRALDVLDRAGNLAAGPGSLLANIPATDARELRGHIDSIKGNIGIDQLLKIKASGAGLGAIPQAQLEMLASLLGNLDSGQNPESLRYNLQRVQEIYSDIVQKSGGNPLEIMEDRGERFGGGTPPPAGGADTSAMTPEELVEFYANGGN